jgi:hypothetical protein
MRGMGSGDKLGSGLEKGGCFRKEREDRGKCPSLSKGVGGGAKLCFRIIFLYFRKQI